MQEESTIKFQLLDVSLQLKMQATHGSLDEVARLQHEVAGLKSELAVSERLRIAMHSSIVPKGGL